MGDMTAGTIGGDFKLDASVNGWECWLDGCTVQKWSFESDEKQGIGVRGRLDPARYYRRGNDDSRPAWITDWYLNGPDDFVWRSATSWTTSISHIRHRGKSLERKFERRGPAPASLDHLSVAIPGLVFALHKVPEHFGPEWSTNVAIEYQSVNGVLPSEETRTGVSEIVSFVLGRRLAKIGSTSFSDDGSPVEQTANSPWGDGIESVCGKVDSPPILIERGRGDSTNAEELLAVLVPRYLELRAELDLSSALWQYWIANETYLGIELPIYASGVEILAHAWFKSKKSKIKGLYMKQEAFEKLLQDELVAIRQKLAGQPYGDRMLRRVIGAHNMGTNERIPMFLEEIGLVFGPEEKRAMAARNTAVHGRKADSDKELEQLIRSGTAYQVLFNRILLRLLDYGGEYIDRCTLGHPMRSLSEPAGSD